MGKTLVTIPNIRNIPFTSTSTSDFITSTVCGLDSTQGIAGTLLASVWVLRCEVPISCSTVITPWTSNVSLTVSLTRHHSILRASLPVTHSPIHCTFLITVTGCTDIWVRDQFGWILVEAGDTVLTVPSLSVMLTVITNTAGCLTAGRIDSIVKVTFVRVFITVAHFALVFLFAKSRAPRPILVEGFAVLAVISHCIMFTFTGSVNHSRNISVSFLFMHTLTGVAIAGTGASDHHAVYGEVVFF